MIWLSDFVFTLWNFWGSGVQPNDETKLRQFCKVDAKSSNFMFQHHAQLCAVSDDFLPGILSTFLFISNSGQIHL
jgi:hypothetical protein